MAKPLNTVLPANTVKYWLHGDTEEMFNKHWQDKSTRDLLILNGYTPETKIQYVLDDHGLRNAGDDWIGHSILTLGCSFTFGTGLSAKDTWSYKLGQTLGMPAYNAGVPGSSCDTAFRLLDILIEEEPEAVFCLAPSEDRWEFLMDDKIENFGPWGEWVYNKERRLVTELHINAKRNKLNKDKNLLAMQKLCEMYSIPFVWLEPRDIPFIDNDWARDLGHQGKQWHTVVADKFKNLYDIKFG